MIFMKQQSFVFRKTTSDDAKEIHKLMKYVYDNLERKDLFMCDSMENVLHILNGHGYGVAVCNLKGDIIASLLCFIPKETEENLGWDLGFCKEELLRVVHMESAVVHPDYRGNGLEDKMLQLAEEWTDKDQYNIFLATVSPYNEASKKTVSRRGYEVRMRKQKYGGLERLIVEKRL